MTVGLLVDVQIDALMADLHTQLLVQPSSDLLGRELQAQVLLDLAPDLGGDAPGVSTGHFACVTVSLGTLGAVHAIGIYAALDLAFDGVNVSAQLPGNRLGLDGLTQQGFDLVSLDLVQVVRLLHDLRE